MAETTNTQTTGYECVGIEKIEQTYEGLYDNKPNIITIYLTNGDTHQFKVMNGSQGVGIDRIEQRQSSSVSGGRNEFAIILTNGKEYTFSTYNGSGGSGSSGSFNQVLQQLNNMLMPSGKSYLFYNGSGFEWKSPDGSTSGGTADLSEYSWWGRKFAPASKMITGEMSAVTSIEFQSTKGETTIVKKLYLDENGDLCFNGNLYATGGITALGSGGGTSGGGNTGGGTISVAGNGTVVNSAVSLLNIQYPSGLSDVVVSEGDGVVDIDLSKVAGSGTGVTLSPVMSQMNKYLTKTTLNTPQFLYWDGKTYTWKNESEISGGGSNSRINTIKLFNSLGNEFDSVYLGTGTAIGFMQGDNVTLQAVVKDNINVIKISADGGSGSSGTTSGKLRFYQDGSEEAWNGESDFKIIFGNGINVTWDSHSQITLSATGGSTGGSVSWSDVTNKPSTFTPSSHTHSTSDISGLDSYVKGTKVSNASAADRLANAVTLWGNSFSGNNSIGTTSSYADLRYVKNIYAGSAFDIEAGNNSLLKVDTSPNIYVGFGYMANNKAALFLFGNKTTIYTNGDDYHYDFKGDVFDVNTNTIHFGYATNGGKISWDANNNAFKIEGNVYATGGITALGVSNSATTSNNLDFTFKSVTADSATFDKLYLRKEYGYGLFVGTKCALWGAIETDAIHIGGNFTQVYMTEWIVINSNSKQCYCATRLQTANGLSLLDGYLDVKYNGTTYKFDFAKAKELGLLINAGVKTLSDEVDYENVIQ